MDDNSAMLIQPRQEILGAWKGIADLCTENGQWRWGDRAGRNSITDAEQLLCLLAPATRISFLALDDPDRTADDVVEALASFGDSSEIPLVLLRATTDYLTTYATADGVPTFAGGRRFVRAHGQSGAVSASQRDLEVVDSFAVSVDLTLAALGFAQNFRKVLTRGALLRKADELTEKAARRLTAAMVGLLRSFAVNTFAPDHRFGERQLRQVNQDGRLSSVVVDDLRAAQRQVLVDFGTDITIGSGAAESRALESSDELFECGWSWGVVRGAPRIAGWAGVAVQHAGVAEKAPYLYFTAMALDAIEILAAERMKKLNLLNPVQARLAGALQVRSRFTHAFWSRVATFGTGARWPLEDLPWQTTDGLEREYYGVLVSGMFVRERNKRPAADADLGKVGRIFAEQAQRSRITRRATAKDRAVVGAHHPGEREPLLGTEEPGPQLAWSVADIAPLLLRRTLQLAGFFDAGQARNEVLDLSDEIWQHMRRRRLETKSVRGVWDQPGAVFPGVGAQTEVSWYHTKRMIDCLIDAGAIVSEQPRPSPRLAEDAKEMLIEADQLLDTALFTSPAKQGSGLRREFDLIRSLLDQARGVQSRNPGMAVVRAGEALQRLTNLEMARVAARKGR